MKQKKNKEPIINADEYLNGTNNVASASECTGIAPVEIKDQIQAQSYADIYDIPVNDTLRSKKKKSGK